MIFAIAYVMNLAQTVMDRFEGRQERGATAVEYGLMVALIAVVIIAAVTLLGGNLSSFFAAAAAKIPTTAG